MQMTNVIIGILALILFLSKMKWRITALSLIYFMKKNRYKLPDKEEMKECTDFVIKNTIKDLTGH